MKSNIRFIKVGGCLAGMIVSILMGLWFVGQAHAKKSGSLSADDLEFFANNRIYFHNSLCVEGFTSSICGDTAAEKYWSAFRQYLDPIQAAGALGNIMGEGDFNPVAWEAKKVTNSSGQFTNGFSWDRLYNQCYESSCRVGVGSVGITSHLSEYLHFVNDEAPELLQYFQNPEKYGFNYIYSKPGSTAADGPPKLQGKAYGDQLIEVVGDEVFNKLVEIEVKFVMEESIGPEGFYTKSNMFDMDKFTAMSTPMEAGKYWAGYYERCNTCNTEATRTARGKNAEFVYDEFEDFACSGGGSSSKSSSLPVTSGGGSGVDITLIGDSVSVYSEKELEAKFPGSYMNMVGSRHPKGGSDVCGNSVDGLTVVKSLATGSGSVPKQHWDSNSCIQQEIDNSSLKDVVVWELGANENGANEKSTLEMLLEVVGNRKLFLVTPYNSLRKSSIDQIVTLYKEFANEHDNVYIIDWNEAVKDDEAKYILPESYAHVHPTDAGKQLLADLIAAAVSGADNCAPEGVTLTEYEGETIAYPIAGATKNNLTLGPVPCDMPGGCHHTAPGSDPAFDVCAEGGGVECVGATVVSMTDGEVTKFTQERHGAYCNHVRIRNAIDGTIIAYMHMEGEEIDLQPGTKVKAGDVIGHVSGNPTCHDNSTPHVHIDKGRDPNATGGPSATNLSERDPMLVEMMNAAYEALPESGNGSVSASNCPEKCKDNKDDKVKSLTEEQAQVLVDYFNGVKGNIVGRKYPLNCPEMVKWFLHYFTDLGLGDPSTYALGNGGDVAHNLAQARDLEEGNEPQPFTVFSSVADGAAFAVDPNTGLKYGHTGLIVGVDGDKLITVETGSGDARIHIRESQALCKSNYATCYTYIGSHVNQSELSKALNGDL